YVLRILQFYRGLFRLKKGENDRLYSVSVVIPARNEADNIEDCLNALVQQSYPKEKIEIIVVNDHSTDATSAIIDHYQTDYENINALHLTQRSENISPKKYAISRGIEQSTHDIVLTTDADCIVPKSWLHNMMHYFEEDVGVVCGFVAFNKKKETTIFHKVQSLEFLSLVIAGAGSIGSDLPLIGNGANLAYRRSVFEEVDGFAGHEGLISGDDDLFIQKVARTTDWHIRFAAENSATVSANPVHTLRQFLNQRSRWASKGIHYHNPLFVIYLISVYLFYAILFFCIPLSFFYSKLMPVVLIAFSLKIIADFLLLYKGTIMVQRRDLLKYFPLAELFQIPYILYVGIAGLLGQFTWKGKKR
ncbi:glycosyltransferase, partial [candidate division KSB1 bacterium]|nr:glycosyltransferase [candidate division KSB1 bacterium]